jgi:hypothetical protein
MFALYVLAKFVLYCAVCYALARSFRLELDSRWMFSIAWGAGRFGLGLLFGLPIAALYVWLLNTHTSPVASYLIAFAPIRIVEWAILFALIARLHKISWGAKADVWVLGGAAVSMLTDGVAILTGATQIKFFC